MYANYLIGHTVKYTNFYLFNILYPKKKIKEEEEELRSTIKLNFFFFPPSCDKKLWANLEKRVIGF